MSLNLDNGRPREAPDSQAPALSRTRARTRAALIEAALELIAEKGFRGATLVEIGQRAGKSKGAVYSNFASKEELFLAVVGSMNLVLKPKLEPGMSIRAVFRAIGEAVVALRPAAAANAAFMAEYKLYALTHAKMKSHLAQRYAGPFEQIERAFAENFAESELPLPAAQLPVVIQALAMGFMEQSFLTPDAVTDDLIVSAFEALAGPERAAAAAS